LDAVLFANALLLAFHAGVAWRGVPMPEALSRLNRCRLLLPKGLSVWHSRCAAVRASRAVGLIGGLDSCVTRSLVLASLLRDHEHVDICIGFRLSMNAGDSDSPQGHAWVCVAGANVSDSVDESSSAAFHESYRLHLRDCQ
jgi:hypothetical protein